MIDKLVTLFIIGVFIGLIGYSIKTIVESGNIFKNVLMSIGTSVVVGLVFDIFSLSPKSPLLYAAIASFLVSLVPEFRFGILQKGKLIKAA
jgi:uncharacterized membrane protein YeaQ/YmgE (transglycosylase-associated protein family)